MGHVCLVRDLTKLTFYTVLSTCSMLYSTTLWRDLQYIQRNLNERPPLWGVLNVMWSLWCGKINMICWCVSGETFLVSAKDPTKRYFLTHPPSTAYMFQWTGSALVQVIAWFIVNWTAGNNFQWSSNRNSIIFIQENASEIVVWKNGGHFVQREMS